MFRRRSAQIYRAKEIAGINVINSSAAIKQRVNGIHFFPKALTCTPARGLATNRFSPKGGETKPIARFVTTIIPRWIISIPNAAAMGDSRGPIMTIAGPTSISIPKISRMIFNAIRKDAFVAKLSSRYSASMDGAPIKVSTRLKALAKAIRAKIGA